MLCIRGDPWKMKPVKSCRVLAPALMALGASSPEDMPPLALMARLSPAC